MRPIKQTNAETGPKRRSKQGERRDEASTWGFPTMGIQSLAFLNRKSRGRKREFSFLKNRFYVVLGAAALLLMGVLWIQEYPQRAYQATLDSILGLSHRMGFQVKDIVVVGRQHASSAQILRQIDLKKNDPIFQSTPEEIRERLKQIPWIRDAQVQRRLPHTLYINVTERKPLAIWQNQKKHALVDDEGVVIPDEKLHNYKHLPIVVGTNAPVHVSEILSVLLKNPAIQSRVTALIWVSGRRWNLQLDRAIEVKLPEGAIEGALTRLTKLLQQDKINFHDVKSIDLRLPKQIVVRFSQGGELNLGKDIDA